MHYRMMNYYRYIEHVLISMDKFSDYYNRGREEKRPGIGFFPGGFKPPHIGHFAAAQAIVGVDISNPETGSSILLPGADISDIVYVLIGHAPRGSETQNKTWTSLKSKKSQDTEAIDTLKETMITKEMSIGVWNLYLDSINENTSNKIDVSISPSASPVIGMETKILGLDSDQFRNNTINLYAGEEDQARYQYFTGDKFKMKIAESKNIEPNMISIKTNMLDRLGSATDARSQVIRVAAEEADMVTLKQYIPPGVDILKFLNLLKTFRG
jgi:hypothetical protein